MNYIINHLKLSAKTYTILFMCLCGMILLIVNFEARVLVKLSIPWDSIVLDVTSLDNSTKALQTSMKENSIAPLKPCQRNTFLGKCYENTTIWNYTITASKGLPSLAETRGGGGVLSFFLHT